MKIEDQINISKILIPAINVKKTKLWIFYILLHVFKQLKKIHANKKHQKFSQFYYILII